LAQASNELTRTQDVRPSHVNKYIMSSPNMRPTQGGMMQLFIGEFYCGLAERIKDQLLSLDRPQTFQQLKIDALRCNTRYWERQSEKTASSGRNRQSALPLHQQNRATTRPCHLTLPRPVEPIQASEQDGKLTQEERERRRLKGLCYYCGLTIDLPAPDWSQLSTPQASCRQVVHIHRHR